MLTLVLFESHRLLLSAGSSCKLALTSSVGREAKSAPAITMDMNSWVGRRWLQMMGTFLPAGSVANRKGLHIENMLDQLTREQLVSLLYDIQIAVTKSSLIGNQQFRRTSLTARWAVCVWPYDRCLEARRSTSKGMGVLNNANAPAPVWLHVLATVVAKVRRLTFFACFTETEYCKNRFTADCKLVILYCATRKLLDWTNQGAEAFCGPG